MDSHGSISSKRAILIGETKRAIACSTNSRATKESLKEVKRSFVNNGYPKAFVDNVIRKTKNNRHNKPAEDCIEKSHLPQITIHKRGLQKTCYGHCTAFWYKECEDLFFKWKATI